MYSDVQAFLVAKGKGRGNNTSGKGFGRRKNPRDRSGNVMTCRNCGSDEHFAAKCPKGGGKGKSFAGWVESSGDLRVEGQWWPPAAGQSMHYAVHEVPARNAGSYNPWQSSELVLDPRTSATRPSEHGYEQAFPVFSTSGSENGSDPLFLNDPWRPTPGPALRPFRTSRVNSDDELSDGADATHQPPPTSTSPRPTMPPTATTQWWSPPPPPQHDPGILFPKASAGERAIDDLRRVVEFSRIDRHTGDMNIPMFANTSLPLMHQGVPGLRAAPPVSIERLKEHTLASRRHLRYEPRDGHSGDASVE